MEETEVDKKIAITFDHPTLEMIKHLKPIYVRAQINGKTLLRVFVDEGAILNKSSFSLTTQNKLAWHLQ